MAHHHEISTTNESKMLTVAIVTVITMVVEIFFGYWSNSMALLADGFHMGTHALALGLSYLAYVLCRKLANSDLFINGPEKINTLAGFVSSIFLGFTAIAILIESVSRFIHPLSIKFDEAIIVAIIGLVVNTVCVVILEFKHEHHEHDEHDEDYNFKSAYYHILADAMTSILAICALLLGKYFHLYYFDAIIGILGGILILVWAYNLIKSTTKILIDMK